MNVPQANPPPNDPNGLKDERDLYRVMTVATALGFGTLAAFLVSLKDIRNDVSLEFTVWTLIAFGVGAAAGWGFWLLVRRRAPGSSRDGSGKF